MRQPNSSPATSRLRLLLLATLALLPLLSGCTRQETTTPADVEQELLLGV